MNLSRQSQVLLCRPVLTAIVFVLTLAGTVLNPAPARQDPEDEPGDGLRLQIFYTHNFDLHERDRP